MISKLVISGFLALWLASCLQVPAKSGTKEVGVPWFADLCKKRSKLSPAELQTVVEILRSQNTTDCDVVQNNILSRGTLQIEGRGIQTLEPIVALAGLKKLEILFPESEYSKYSFGYLIDDLMILAQLKSLGEIQIGHYVIRDFNTLSGWDRGLKILEQASFFFKKRDDSASLTEAIARYRKVFDVDHVPLELTHLAQEQILRLSYFDAAKGNTKQWLDSCQSNVNVLQSQDPQAPYYYWHARCLFDLALAGKEKNLKKFLEAVDGLYREIKSGSERFGEYEGVFVFKSGLSVGIPPLR